MSTAVKVALDMERCERQARLTLALGGIAAVAVDLFHSETGRIEQLVRVSPPAREESGEDGTELDVDYLVSPPELTPFLAEALQRSSVYQEPIEIATQGQLSEAACKVAQQLLGVTHLVACRVETELGAPGLLVMAARRATTAAEAPLIEGIAGSLATNLDGHAVRGEPEREQGLLTGILAVADAARLDASERIDSLLESIAHRLRSTLDADSVLLAVAEGDAGWQLGVSLSDTGRVLHPDWKSGAADPPKGLAGWTHATGEAALTANLAEDQRASQKHDGRGPETVISVPLAARGHVIGVLRAGSAHIGQFGGPELEALEALGRQTAIVVENGQLYMKTRRQNERLAQFARVVRSSPDAIVLADLEEHIHHCNPATERLFGYGEAELIGRRVASMLGVSSLEAIRLGEPAGEWDRELRLPRKDGSRFSAEVHVSLVEDDDGRALGSATIIRDMTGRKQLEQQLVQSEKLRSVGVMASGVAHQMNNTLASVVGQADLVLNTTNDPETKTRMASIIQAAEDGAAAVRRIRDFARESTPEAFDPVDLAAVANDVLEATAVRWRDQAQLEGRKIETGVTVTGSSWIPGSPAELREALTNLVLNSVDALPEGGHIGIEIAEEESKILLRVRDDGIGMPLEVAQRAFDPFFTTKPFGSGTGLGLALTRGIVQRHHGSIDVRSNPGGGTTFDLRFPRAEPAFDAPESPAATPTKAIRVLVVEDEPVLCEQLRAILSIDHHQVRVCTGGPEGLEALRTDDYDLVITDLGMPDVDGWEIARAAKERRPATHVALVTGWAGEVADRTDLAERGVDTVISKPYRIQTIRDAVAGVTKQ